MERGKGPFQRARERRRPCRGQTGKGLPAKAVSGAGVPPVTQKRQMPELGQGIRVEFHSARQEADTLKTFLIILPQIYKKINFQLDFL